MKKSLPLAILAGGALLSGTAAIAATQAKTVQPKTVATHTTTTKTTTPMGNARVARRTTTVAKGRMVTAKLANGKTVTYNCALAGNKTKAACK
ncbi:MULTISPECIES: hypothetical protein [unclassified Sphingomonas]|uniref:hypothetical protein n=1 Tax=unclassified Sphingomonas TaxID=196159 RepID=UPI0006FD23AC|nr:MULTISPECIES: hypothetical protein [unclassified Sphingomonas]KQN27403.1 hypothetical protein ASF00_13960 [Sphingomonas sp. Leaf34]KQN33570.1 hypothetical protein ASE88_00575 [Sphingomonas sp. Leaf38]